MELPMNLVMKRLGANVTLPVMVILWGVVCACQGAVHSYRGLLVCRFSLALSKVWSIDTCQHLSDPIDVHPLGGSPGITLLFSNFYKRHALQLRCALLFSVGSLTGAFSGLLAYGILNLDGKHGIAGWQWIFIVEGGLLGGFWTRHSLFRACFATEHQLLTKVERETYCRDLADDWSGDADTDGTYQEVFSWSEVASVFTDAPHVLMLAFPMFFSGATIYGLAYFTPTIVNALGHSPNRTQLLTVPPYACSFVFSIVSAYFSDKYKCRGLTSTVCALIAAIGYAMFLGASPCPAV
ncbi:major facilitator superfamily domain-containing protein [Lactarius pseudohatsudake]|nr:major facilitator superfamily domain-containing protein [Lactarius pseudohatsudake]